MKYNIVMIHTVKIFYLNKKISRTAKNTFSSEFVGGNKSLSELILTYFFQYKGVWITKTEF